MHPDSQGHGSRKNGPQGVGLLPLLLLRFCVSLEDESDDMKIKITANQQNKTAADAND